MHLFSNRYSSQITPGFLCLKQKLDCIEIDLLDCTQVTSLGPNRQAVNNASPAKHTSADEHNLNQILNRTVRMGSFSKHKSEDVKRH